MDGIRRELFPHSNRPYAVLHPITGPYRMMTDARVLGRLSDHLVRLRDLNICLIGGRGSHSYLHAISTNMDWRDRGGILMQPLDIVIAILAEADAD